MRRREKEGNEEGTRRRRRRGEKEKENKNKNKKQYWHTLDTQRNSSHQRRSASQAHAGTT